MLYLQIKFLFIFIEHSQWMRNSDEGVDGVSIEKELNCI